MGIFDFLFQGPSKLEDYQDRVFQFVPDKISRQQIVKVKVGEYVNLWRSDKSNDVVVFASGGVGGSGYLGIVPSKYSTMIRRHLDECHQTEISSYYHYKAEIIEIGNLECTISVTLHSKDARIRMVEDDLKSARDKTFAAFEKNYTLRKSVKLKFDLLRDIKPSDTVRLKILPKETYIDDPYNCPIELTLSDGAVVGRTRSQKSECFRVIRSYFSRQNLVIVKKEQIRDQLTIEVAAEG